MSWVLQPREKHGDVFLFEVFRCFSFFASNGLGVSRLVMIKSFACMAKELLLGNLAEKSSVFRFKKTLFVGLSYLSLL